MWKLALSIFTYKQTMTQRDEDFAGMIQDLVQFVIKIKTQVVGSQVCVLLNIALDCVSGLLES